MSDLGPPARDPLPPEFVSERGSPGGRFNPGLWQFFQPDVLRKDTRMTWDPGWNADPPNATNQGLDYNAIGIGPVAAWWRERGGLPAATAYWNAADPQFRAQYGGMWAQLQGLLGDTGGHLPPGPVADAPMHPAFQGPPAGAPMKYGLGTDDTGLGLPDNVGMQQKSWLHPGSPWAGKARKVLGYLNQPNPTMRF